MRGFSNREEARQGNAVFILTHCSITVSMASSMTSDAAEFLSLLYLIRQLCSSRSCKWRVAARMRPVVAEYPASHVSLVAPIDVSAPIDAQSYIGLETSAARQEITRLQTLSSPQSSTRRSNHKYARALSTKSCSCTEAASLRSSSLPQGTSFYQSLERSSSHRHLPSGNLSRSIPTQLSGSLVV